MQVKGHFVLPAKSMGINQEVGALGAVEEKRTCLKIVYTFTFTIAVAGVA